ncbi:MAG TPA: polysaccharide deacetylase family protein [Blastocatellia bacterium]|nr:polysaccharide deacetylase family protein [Blastocatellia bacterium]
MLKLMKVTGSFAPFRFANRNRALILTYHRFGDGSDGAMTSARDFCEQLDYLAAHYEIVPLSFIAARLRTKRGLPARVAAITIDDGYSDSYAVAFPILRDRNLPATIFVVTEFVERKIWMWTDKLRYLALRARKESLEATVANRELRFTLNGRASRVTAAERVNAVLKSISEDDKNKAIARLSESLGVEIPGTPPDDLGPITWQQAREMDRAGVEIASHTLTHPILTNVGPDQLRGEVAESRARLQSILKRKVDLFCYPNGSYNRAVVNEVERAGYASAVTVEHGLNDGQSHPFALKRIHTEPDIAHFVQSTSGFEQIKASLHAVRTKGMSRAGL